MATARWWPFLTVAWFKCTEGDDTANRDAEERGMTRAFPPMPFHKGATGAEVPFYKPIISNFIIYRNGIERILLQLFEHPETSEWFSIISSVIFDVNIFHERKQA